MPENIVKSVFEYEPFTCSKDLIGLLSCRHAAIVQRNAAYAAATAELELLSTKIGEAIAELEVSGGGDSGAIHSLLEQAEKKVPDRDSVFAADTKWIQAIGERTDWLIKREQGAWEERNGITCVEFDERYRVEVGLVPHGPGSRENAPYRPRKKSLYGLPMQPTGVA